MNNSLHNASVARPERITLRTAHAAIISPGALPGTRHVAQLNLSHNSEKAKLFHGGPMEVIHEGIVSCFALRASDGETEVHIHFPVVRVNLEDEESPSKSEQKLYRNFLKNWSEKLMLMVQGEANQLSIAEIQEEALAYIKHYTEPLQRAFPHKKPVLYIMGGTTNANSSLPYMDELAELHGELAAIKEQLDAVHAGHDQHAPDDYQELCDSYTKIIALQEKSIEEVQNKLGDKMELGDFSPLLGRMLVTYLGEQGYDVRVLEEHAFVDNYGSTRDFHIAVNVPASRCEDVEATPPVPPDNKPDIMVVPYGAQPQIPRNPEDDVIGVAAREALTERAERPLGNNL